MIATSLQKRRRRISADQVQVNGQYWCRISGITKRARVLSLESAGVWRVSTGPSRTAYVTIRDIFRPAK